MIQVPTDGLHDAGTWVPDMEEDLVELLLTSGGITNPSLERALVDLLGKPIAESSALVVPTAQWGHPMCGPAHVQRSIADGTLAGLGWGSLGVLELTALPSIGPARWVPWVRETDVLLVEGGDATYLCHWMRESGLADLLPELHDTVWVGMSAGSMVLTPRIGQDFVEWEGAADDRTLGLVDFSIFPHLDVFPSNTLVQARRWAGEVGGPAYVLDDRSAVRVVDGVAEVVSEGEWHLLAAEPD